MSRCTRKSKTIGPERKRPGKRKRNGEKERKKNREKTISKEALEGQSVIS